MLRIVLKALFGEFASHYLEDPGQAPPMYSENVLILDRDQFPMQWAADRRCAGWFTATHVAVVSAMPGVATYMRSPTVLPTLGAIQAALPRRIHPLDPSGQPYTMYEFIMYSFDCNGDFDFGLRMWEEALRWI